MESGIYIAVFFLPVSKSIQVGRLGKYYFHKGIFFYVGSAQRNLSARLKRHSKRKKPLHWHIDYLSVNARMLGAITIAGSREFECELVKELGKMFKLAKPGFGASDCRCAGHLFYVKDFAKI